MPARLITPPASEPVSLVEAKNHLRIEHGLDDLYISALITAARTYVEEICWRGLLQQTLELVVDGFHGDNLLEQRRPLIGSWPTDWVTTLGHRSLSHWEPFIELGHGHLATPVDGTSPVLSVKYIDQAGAQQTLSPSGYVVDATSRPGRIRLPYGVEWPDTRPQWDAVRVQYMVGWATAELLPAWAAATQYATVGTRVTANVGGTPYVFQVTAGGTSGATAPSWSATLGASVTDNTVTWKNEGIYDPLPRPIHQALLLLISQMYEHRTPEVDRTIAQVQFAFDALIAPYRMLRVM